MNVQEHLYSGVTFGASRNTDLACGLWLILTAELTDHFVGEQEVNTFDSLATNPGLQQELQ
jgi:hypothetical protein